MKHISKSIFSALLAMSAGAASAADGLAVLDLSKADTQLTFDAATGQWSETFSDEEPTIDSQLYCFMHSALPSYQTWWGFTASNSINNQPQTDWIAWQYSNMAKGGIALDENGTVKLNENAAPVIDPAMPYMVAYYNKYMARKPVQLLTNDGEAHEAVSCYVNLNSYTYYSTLFGDAVARSFTERDSLTLSIHGVADDNTEKTVDVTLASFKNGQLTAATGWMYVDLTPLGAVNELYFTMESTDTGSWGMNTPGYFCLDKLTMKDGSSSATATEASSRLRYNRADRILTAAPGSFIALYTPSGSLVMSSEDGLLNVASAQPGIYIARCNNHSLKIVI